LYFVGRIPYVISQISNQNDEILYQKTNAKLPKVFSASAIEAIKKGFVEPKDDPFK
jgi:hypothetical protein